MKTLITLAFTVLAVGAGAVNAGQFGAVTDAAKQAGKVTKEAGKAAGDAAEKGGKATEKAVKKGAEKTKETVTGEAQATCADGSKQSGADKKAAAAACEGHGGVAK
jgi:hypothetical protein